MHVSGQHFDMHVGRSAGRLPEKKLVLQAAGDAVETLPMDIMDLQPPDSLVPSSSPEVSSMRRRAEYQRTSRHPCPPIATWTLPVMTD